MSLFFKKIRIGSNDIYCKDEDIRNKVGSTTIERTPDNYSLINSPASYSDYIANNYRTRSQRYEWHRRDIIAGNNYTAQRHLEIDGVWQNREYQLTDFDTNRAGTQASPYESLDRFFENLNEGMTDIRCYINQGGYYIVHRPVIDNCVIHIDVNASNVHILVSDSDLTTEAMAFYNSHVNIKVGSGYTGCSIEHAKSTSTQEIYFENCATLIDGLDFNCYLAVYGGYMSHSNCKVQRYRITGATAYLNDIEITNTDNTVDGISIERGSGVIMSGTSMDFDTLPTVGSTNAMIRVNDSQLNVEFAQDVYSNYGYGIIADGSTIYMTMGRQKSFYDNSINHNDFTSGINSVFSATNTFGIYTG